MSKFSGIKDKKMSRFWCLNRRDEARGPTESGKEAKELIKKYEWLADILPRPSTLWIQKAITLFSRFDKDGDGYLSEKDILLYVNAYKKHGCMSNERAARMRDKTFSFWTLLNKGAKKVTMEEFVKARIADISNGAVSNSGGEHNLEDIATLMFYSIDNNEDGSVSMQELVLFFKCIDVDGSFAREVFAKLDVNKDSKISKAEFATAFRDFLNNQEESPSKELFGPLEELEVS